MLIQLQYFIADAFGLSLIWCIGVSMTTDMKNIQLLILIFSSSYDDVVDLENHPA